MSIETSTENLENISYIYSVSYEKIKISQIDLSINLRFRNTRRIFHTGSEVHFLGRYKSQLQITILTMALIYGRLRSLNYVHFIYISSYEPLRISSSNETIFLFDV